MAVCAVATMASSTLRRTSASARGIRDPPGCTYGDRRASRDDPSCRDVRPSAVKTKPRGSSRGAGDAHAPRRDRDGDAESAATPSTAACTADESSLSGAEEGQGCSGGSDDAVACDAVAGCSSAKTPRCDRQHVRQAVAQLQAEQTLARDAWNEVAEDYHHRVEPFTASFVPQLLDARRLASSCPEERDYLTGLSVLDVATGTGAGALYAASRGASSVTATDFSESMLQVLQSRLDADNIEHVETRLANGLCLPLGWTDSYDVVLSNFGVIYFPSVREGLSEMVRCAKPGGKVCISGWGSREETSAFGIFPAAIQRCGLGRKWRAVQQAARRQLLVAAGRRRRSSRRGRNLAPNYFCPAARVSSSGPLLRSLLVDAGLDDVRVVAVERELEWHGSSYWERFVQASPNLRRFVEHGLGPEEVRRLKDAVAELLHEESPNPQQGEGDGNGVVLTASAYIAVGTKT